MEQRRLNGTFPELDLFFFKLKQLVPHRAFTFSNKRREPKSTVAQRSEALDRAGHDHFPCRPPSRQPSSSPTISAAIQ